MRISTSVTFQLTENIGEYIEVSRVSFEYDGPIALAKKGRESMAANTAFQQQQAKQLASQGNQQYGILNNLENEEIASTTPGSLSPAAQAMFASDLSNINATYNGLRQNAFATAGARGFGSAPSGFQQTSINAINQGQNRAATDAFRQAQINTEQQRQNVMGSGLRVTGIVCLLLPHLIGAPVGRGENAVPAQLIRRFAITSSVTTGIFWLVLGITGGFLCSRFEADQEEGLQPTTHSPGKGAGTKRTVR